MLAEQTQHVGGYLLLDPKQQPQVAFECALNSEACDPSTHTAYHLYAWNYYNYCVLRQLYDDYDV